MRKKRIIQHKKAHSIVWIALCLLFMLPLGSSTLYAFHAHKMQQVTIKLNSFYTLNEGVKPIYRPKISIKAKNAPLISVLKKVALKAQVGISYKNDMIPDKMVTVNIVDTPIFQALREILEGTQLKVVLPYSRDVLVIKKKRLQIEQKLQTGSITGTVTNQQGDPVPTANVFLVEISRGAATNLEGKYTIENVEAGTYTLRVTFVGYREYTGQVTIEAEEQTTHNVVLTDEVLEMEQLVVTGAGVVTEKRRLGQSVGTVGGDELGEMPVSSVSDALQGRIPGVVGSPIGEAGASSPIRIRGTVSLTQRNGPLIYVDGVRVSSDRGSFASIQTSMLDQINPDNIERIEVLKGAAAATLFGTEASSGVIMITTKKGLGMDESMQWSFSTEQGFTKYPLGRIPSNVVYNDETNQIMSNSPAGHYIDAGYSQSYNLSVRGGLDNVGYFASGWYKNVNGGLPTNGVNNSGLRLNLTTEPMDNMELRLGLNTIFNKVRVPYPSWGLMGEFVLADPRIAGPGQPFGELYHSIPGVLAYNNFQRTARSTISLEVNYRFVEGLRAHFLFGYHRRNQRSVISVPPGPDQAEPNGLRDVTNSNGEETTVEASLSWNAQVSGSLSSTLTVGGQAFWDNHRNTLAAVTNYPGLAVRTLRGGTTITDLDEFYQEVISAGVFAQEQIGINNRLFLTGGLRVDGNSAFGEGFGFAFYPRAGLSWVLSDEPFWNIEFFDMLRLRAAYGTSGLQPGVYDALRTWEIESLLGGEPVLIPGSYGNENLKPERSREIEVGFNTEFFDRRVGIDVTYYWQTTSDAILAKQLAPSGGFLQPQLVNIGGLESQGLEIGADWTAVNSANIQWEIYGTFATRDQIVSDLGGIPAFRAGSNRQWNFVKEGYQPGAIIGPVLNPDNPYDLAVPVEQLTSLDQVQPNYLLNDDGSRALRFLGNQLPTIMGSLGMALNLQKYNLRFSVLFRAEGGFVMHNETRQVRVGSKITPMTARMIRDLADPGTSTERRNEIANEYAHNYPEIIQGFVSDGDYLRLQEVAVTWDIPTQLATSLSVTNASITLAGRNLWLLTGYEGIVDPGSSSHGDALEANIDYFGSPNPSLVQMDIKIVF